MAGTPVSTTPSAIESPVNPITTTPTPTAVFPMTSPFGSLTSAAATSFSNSSATVTTNVAYSNGNNEESAKPIDIVASMGAVQITSSSSSRGSQQQQQQPLDLSGSNDAIFATASLGPIAPVDMADLVFVEGTFGGVGSSGSTKKPRERRHTAVQFECSTNLKIRNILFVVFRKSFSNIITEPIAVGLL